MGEKAVNGRSEQQPGCNTVVGAWIVCSWHAGLMQGKGRRRRKDPDEMDANVIYAWALGRHFVLLSRRLGLDTACSDTANF